MSVKRFLITPPTEGGATVEAKQGPGSKPGSSVPGWALFQFLPPGSFRVPARTSSLSSDELTPE